MARALGLAKQTEKATVAVACLLGALQDRDRWLLVYLNAGTRRQRRRIDQACLTLLSADASDRVEVLLKVYAKCLDGHDETARRRVQEALGYGST